MITVMKKKYLTIFLLISIIALHSGCKLNWNAKTNESMEIIVKGSSFTLAWDSGGPDIPNNPNSAVQYKVYYRNHGSYYWRLLMEIENSGSSECIINDEIMDYGVYDFAVSAVSEQGNESAFHSSLDSTANPFTGWYINWIGSN